MANLCSFDMLVKGEKENIEKFYKALTQESKDVWIGRGADADIEYDDEYDEATISGYCKWSVESSLFDDALSMEKQRITGKGRWYWDDKISEVKRFLTLFQAADELKLNIEVYSTEPGCQFAEHYKYENGECIDDECEPYQEVWNEDSGEYIEEGGFGEWSFDLKQPIYA